jgi:hypothetical protein
MCSIELVFDGGGLFRGWGVGLGKNGRQTDEKSDKTGPILVLYGKM